MGVLWGRQGLLASDSQNGFEVHSLQPDGATQVWALLGASSKSGVFANQFMDQFMVSPDGSSWAWVQHSDQPNGGVSEVFVGGPGKPGQKIHELVSRSKALRMLWWGQRGLYFFESPEGMGGYIPFPVNLGTVYRYDPASGQVAQVPGTGDKCGFLDQAPDGSVACLVNLQCPPVAALCYRGRQALEMVTAGKVLSSVTLPFPAFNDAGASGFRAQGRLVLAVSGAALSGPDRPESYTIDLFDPATGSLTPFGPPGLRVVWAPWAWLPDGSLLADRPPGLGLGAPNPLGGPPGLYRIAPDGSSATQILPGGCWEVGVIQAVS